VAAAGWAGVDIEEFPHLKAWEDRMARREGTEKGRHVPSKHTIKDLIKDKAAMEKSAAETRSWVQQGMKEDSKNKI
jgi:glutathione S-transferase